MNNDLFKILEDVKNKKITVKEAERKVKTENYIMLSEYIGITVKSDFFQGREKLITKTVPVCM